MREMLEYVLLPAEVNRLTTHGFKTTCGVSRGEEEEEAERFSSS